MIDLSPMKAVRVDAATQRAWVEPGATLADVDRETQAHGLALPTGINSTTGIAGLTLGGGFGWLTRKFGLTLDNLLSVDVVTADGELRRASASGEPGSVLGAARRRREFRCRDRVRVSASQTRAGGPVGAGRASVRRCRNDPHGIPARAGSRAGRADLLGGDAAGAAAAVPAGRMARQGGAGSGHVLLRRYRNGREGDRRAALDRNADRRCGRAQSVHGVAAGLRSSARTRRPQLLEEPRLRRDLRRHRRRS